MFFFLIWLPHPVVMNKKLFGTVMPSVRKARHMRILWNEMDIFVKRGVDSSDNFLVTPLKVMRVSNFKSVKHLVTFRVAHRSFLRSTTSTRLKNEL